MNLPITFVIFAQICFVVSTKRDKNSSDQSNELISFQQRTVFEKWMKKHHKTYKKSTKSKEKAMKVFFDNSEAIETFNKRANETYTRAISEHSDMTLEEKKKFRLGLKSPLRTRSFYPVPLMFINITLIPEKVNYTKFMTPVKDQYACGSCYSFAATAVTEYHNRKLGGNLTLSQQNLIDCDTSTFGCDGGWPTNSLQYIRDEGIASESSYVYEAEVQKCRKDSIPQVYKIENVCEFEVEDDEEKLKKLIAKVGPVAGVIQVTEGLYSYSDGVFYDPTCDSNEYNHAITIVGYGTSKKTGDYWIIRNSWGNSWGRRGYAHIARNRNNTACGLAKYAIYVC